MLFRLKISLEIESLTQKSVPWKTISYREAIITITRSVVATLTGRMKLKSP